MKIDISTGRSRKETSWKTQSVTWQQLTKRLATPVRTYETVKQYPSLPKDKQDELKDVGAAGAVDTLDMGLHGRSPWIATIAQ